MNEYNSCDSDSPREPRRITTKGSSHAKSYVVVLVAGLILGSLGLWGAKALVDVFRGNRSGVDPTAKLREPAPTAPLDADEQESVKLFETVRDSVVNVDVVMVKQGRWDEQPTETTASGGSGFIWDTGGHIVTNYHVVADLNKRDDLELRVVLADRTSYRADLVGTSPDNDLAVVQIHAPSDKLKPIAVGTSNDLKVGQKAFAIGNPLGLSLTMTKGIISSLNRIIESPNGTKIPHVIQTDAAINPGNSGGPLLDKSGRLIGVNTSIATTNGTGGNIGIGFSIPVDAVNRVVTELIQSGKSLRPDLGVKLYDERRLRQTRFDHGVMIDRVLPGKAAAKAGLRGVKRNARGGPAEPGDLIIAINGQTVDNVEDYERVVHDLKVGEQAKVKVIRGSMEMEVSATVDGV